MRIKVDLIPVDKELFLPWSYADWLQGLLYHALRLGIPQVAQFVHDVGFSAGNKKYKLITFSLLQPTAYEPSRDGLRIKGALSWSVSSPVSKLIEAVALGLLVGPDVRLGQNPLRVENVCVVPEPKFGERMIFTTLSPICASTGERDEAGRFGKRFLSPEEPDFGRVLNENLRRKFASLHGTSSAGEVKFSLLDEPRSKLLSVNGTQVRGWLMRFIAEGPQDLLRIGYEAGFGERNAQGFGMVGVLERATIWRE